MRLASRAALIAAIVLSPAAALAGPAIHHVGGDHKARPAPPPAGRPIAHRPADLRPDGPHRHHRHPWTGWGFGDVLPRTIVIAPPPAPPAPRPAQPLSMSLADPGAIAIRLPSGRIAIRGPGDFGAPAASTRQPYAPPSFQIIGRAAGRHMERPVHLVHGAPAPDGFPMNPRVIWIKESGKPVKAAE